VRPGELDRGAVNREIEPPLELGLPYWFHLFFPGRPLTTDLSLLVIGCEDDLAVRLARANPRARVMALDERPAALESAGRAREQRNLTNLHLVSAWPAKSRASQSFDLIYYNTPSWPGEPSAGLERAGELLRRDGSMHLTLRAKYAWMGVRTVRELLDRLGIEVNAEGFPRARQLVAALAPQHPWNMLGPAPETRPDEMLADWLRPAEPCFSVPEVYALLAGSGLALQRFTYQAYYLPQCSALARTPLLADVRQLPSEQQHALMELYWPQVRYHLVVACRADRPAHTFETDFTGSDWLRYAPLLPARLPLEEDESPIGAKARLCWRAAGMPEAGFALGGFQYRLLRALDRAEELGDVVGVAGLSGDPQLRDEWARDFFRLMADYDFLHFRTQPAPDRFGVTLQDRPAAGVLQTPAAGGGLEAGPAALSPPPVAAPTEGVQPPGEGPLHDSATAPQAGQSVAAAQPPQLPPQASEPAGRTLPAEVCFPGPSQASLLSAKPAVPRSAAGAEQAHESGGRFERVPYEACPLCSEPGYQPFRQAEAVFPDPTELVRVPIAWARCGRCEHVFTAGYFAGESWRRIHDASSQGRGSLLPALAKRPAASRIVSAITTLRERATGRWLDIGCSHSGLAAAAAEFGYDSVGLDCCRQAAARLQRLGYEVRCASLFDCSDGPFDVISLSDMLDRMPFPSQALRHVATLLAPHGLLFLSMPSRDSLGWRNLDLEGINPYWARLERYHAFHRKSVFRLLGATGFDPCSYGAGAPEPVGMEILACQAAGRAPRRQRRLRSLMDRLP
jgi:SAM-dependent methyltransferase